MEKFLESQKLPNLTPEILDNLNSLIYVKEFEFLFKNVHANKTPGSDGFPGNSTKH